jgi:hypothetical protein
MKHVVSFVAFVGLAGTAFASIMSAPRSGVPSPGGYSGRAATYAADDGTAETAIGLSNGGVLAAINHFAVTGGNNLITSVDVSWGAGGGTGVVPNMPFNIYVWANNGPGTNPTGSNSTLLFSASALIDGSNIDNNTFQSVAVPNIAVGASFFVGMSIAHAAGVYPIGVDLSDPILLGTSWGAGGDSFDPNNVNFAGGGSLDLAAVGFGNVMIRANAIPAPGAAALLGLAGLVATRRRR